MRNLRISMFNSKKDNRPKVKMLAWSDLVKLLTSHEARTGHDGPAWSPASYAEGANRGNSNVLEIQALVIDIDTPCDLGTLKAYWSPYEYVVHSTHSHTKEAPRYRIAFPLAEPVGATDWPDVWTRLIVPLSQGHFDEACSDPSRIYYLPACTAEGEADAVAEHHSGAWLSVGSVQDWRPKPREAERPGDEFNRTSTWDEVLSSSGAVRTSTGKDLWVRPGKNPRDGHSARSGLGASDLLYVYSSNWQPFEVGRSYTKFAAHVMLNHNGDFSAAAKALAKSGYGTQLPADTGQEAHNNRDSAATKLVKMVQDMGVVLHCSEAGDCYAEIPEPVRDLLKINRSDFKDWLRSSFYRKFGKSASEQAITEAVSILSCSARYDSEKRIKVHVRVAGDNETIWIDIGDNERSIVKVTAFGWEVVRDAPVHFWRPKQMFALPMPEKGGQASELRAFVNVGTDDDLMLMLAWAVMSLHPSGPYPVLVLTGQRGSAKSTAARMLKRLIDPSCLEDRNLSNDEKDLKAAAVNSHVLYFDNLSKIPGHMSDNLCKLSTGGGISNRANYTDDEEAVFEGKRPIIVTAIEDVVEKPDLVDRSLFPRLPVIVDSYRPEQDIWSEFDLAKGRLFGSLLGALSLGLRDVGNVPVDGRFRMADFAKFAQAASPAFGLSRSFYEAYDKNRAEVHQNVADASPICSAILAIVEDSGSWRGSPTELVEAMKKKTPSEADQRSLPIATQVKSRLKTVLPLLREQGVEYEEGRSGRHRWMSFTKVVNVAVTAVTPSPLSVLARAVQESKGDSGDGSDGDVDEKEVF